MYNSDMERVVIHDVTDFIISRLVDGGGYLNQLKLQKLLYYTQAWHLAHFSTPLFIGRFQAWVHGPVNREIFNRFRSTKMLYSEVGREDIIDGFNSEQSLPEDTQEFIEVILETYGPLTGDQLETLTHHEDPWILARKRCRPDEYCENEIDESVMTQYYRARLSG